MVLSGIIFEAGFLVSSWKDAAIYCSKQTKQGNDVAKLSAAEPASQPMLSGNSLVKPVWTRSVLFNQANQETHYDGETKALEPNVVWHMFILHRLSLYLTYCVLCISSLHENGTVQGVLEKVQYCFIMLVLCRGHMIFSWRCNRLNESFLSLQVDSSESS